MFKDNLSLANLTLIVENIQISKKNLVSYLFYSKNKEKAKEKH